MNFSPTLNRCLVLCVLLAACDQPPHRVPIVMPADVESMCRDFGGVKELGSQSQSIRPGKRESSISAYCGDGSYVARWVESKR